MNLALIRKTALDTLAVFVLVVAGLVAFEFLFVRAMSEFAEELLQFWARRPAIKGFIQVLVGSQFNLDISATGLMTIGLAHPLLFALTWTFILANGSRVIAGEIDRGTADLLLALPVSRVGVYFSVSLVWIVAGAAISFAPLAGVWLGELWHPLQEPLDLARLVIPAVNLFGLFLAVMAATMLVSALASRRGPVIGVLLALLLSSFLINFLSQLWPAARHLNFLSVLEYYRPLASVRDGAWPVRDLIVLLTTAVVCWSAGLWCFSRRDIPAA